MKKLLNKSVTLIDPQTRAPLSHTYAELGILALDQVPEGGFTPSEIRSRAEVEDALAGAPADEYILLEDAVAKKLEQCVSGSVWRIRNVAIADFVDAVKNMEHIDPAELKERYAGHASAQPE